MGLRPIPVGSCGFAAGEIPGVQPGKAEHKGAERPTLFFLLYQKEAKINSALRAVLSLRSRFIQYLSPYPLVFCSSIAFIISAIFAAASAGGIPTLLILATTV